MGNYDSDYDPRIPVRMERGHCAHHYEDTEREDSRTAELNRQTEGLVEFFEREIFWQNLVKKHFGVVKRD